MTYHPAPQQPGKAGGDRGESEVTFLLDVNILLAAIWTTHSQHAKADAWIQGKKVALCPLSELGFLRISSHKKAIGAAMADAKRLLVDFYTNVSPQFLAADLSAVALNAATSEAVTDTYLADLAQRHNMKLATLDSGIVHTAIELIR